MPAIAAIVINDGAGTPVAHTFSPVTTNGSKAQWADRSAAIPSAFSTIEHSVEAPSGNRSVYRVTMGFKFPRTATVDGVTVVARYDSAQVLLNASPDSTLQDRKDDWALMSNFMANSTVKTSVENLEPFY